MNKLLGAAAVALLIATPALAETMAAQAPTSQVASAEAPRHDRSIRHERAERAPHHRTARALSSLAASPCAADSTDEAGLPVNPGGYCMPGGRS